MKPSSMDLKNLSLFIFVGFVVILLWPLPGGFSARAQAAQPPPPETSANAPTGGPFGCTIANIAVLSNRIHVHCTTALPGTSISYFAADGDAAHSLTTNRFLVLLNTAYSLSKPVYIYYLDNAASNPTGCNSGDCRAIDWIFITP
jgi:hypothetical protein